MVSFCNLYIQNFLILAPYVLYVWYWSSHSSYPQAVFGLHVSTPIWSNFPQVRHMSGIYDNVVSLPLMIYLAPSMQDYVHSCVETLYYQLPYYRVGQWNGKISKQKTDTWIFCLLVINEKHMNNHFVLCHFENLSWKQRPQDGFRFDPRIPQVRTWNCSWPFAPSPQELQLLHLEFAVLNPR